jgi:hypothetical protein
MASYALHPETLEERLIYWAIVSTWVLWLLGALMLVGPALGYGLLAIVIARALGLADEADENKRIPASALLWVAGMLAMLLALVVGHLDFEIADELMAKSIMGWAKGWALLAVFVVVGAVLRVRAQIVYRATGILALQTLLLAPVFTMAPQIGLPDTLYVSPLSVIGGPGPEFFDVSLFVTGDSSGKIRWRFFAPWATAAAFLAGIGFIFALYERSRVWLIVGVISSIVVCTMAGSRISIVVLPMTVVAVLLISNARRPSLILLAAVLTTMAVLMTDDIVMAYEDMTEAFDQARAHSSRVRKALANIAYHRWWTEAVWFGHGAVERGPHLVEYMKIGSHHTWHGLLFVKGIVGFAGLAVPMAWSVLELAVKAQTDRVARAALGVLIAVLLFSLADNLEIVAYFVWPGFLVVGIALGRRLHSPFHGQLGLRRS